jgi:hypothetical protein
LEGGKSINTGGQGGGGGWQWMGQKREEEKPSLPVPPFVSLQLFELAAGHPQEACCGLWPCEKMFTPNFSLFEKTTTQKDHSSMLLFGCHLLDPPPSSFGLIFPMANSTLVPLLLQPTSLFVCMFLCPLTRGTVAAACTKMATKTTKPGNSRMFSSLLLLGLGP